MLTDRRTVPMTAVLAGLVAVAVAVWWLGPTLDGSDDDVDVLVVSDDVLAGARRSVELRVRETGRAIDWHDGPGLCDDIGDLAARVEATDPGRVVVALSDVAPCPEAAATALGGTERLIIVATDGGPRPEALAGAEFDVVDATRLVGVAGESITMPCEWWEQPCPLEGIVVRGPDGALTEAGGERLARVVAAEL